MTDEPASETPFSLIHLQGKLWIAAHTIGMHRYDFPFESHFACRHPLHFSTPITAIARMGAAEDYDARYAEFASLGIHLIHTPADYRLTSTLPEWYPKLEGLTPRSRWYATPPTAEQVKEDFTFPVFVKGERQTSRHKRAASILESPAAFDAAMAAWKSDPILAWQQVVVREFIPLRPVGPQSAHTLPRVFEFRSFWWKGRNVGIGPYWQDDPYALTATEREAALALGQEVAGRINVPFLCIDLAQTVDGRWIIIEINDGQDAGYAGVKPRDMWQKNLDFENK